MTRRFLILLCSIAFAVLGYLALGTLERRPYFIRIPIPPAPTISAGEQVVSPDTREVQAQTSSRDAPRSAPSASSRASIPLRSDVRPVDREASGQVDVTSSPLPPLIVAPPVGIVSPSPSPSSSVDFVPVTPRSAPADNPPVPPVDSTSPEPAGDTSVSETRAVRDALRDIRPR